MYSFAANNELINSSLQTIETEVIEWLRQYIQEHAKELDAERIVVTDRKVWVFVSEPMLLETDVDQALWNLDDILNANYNIFGSITNAIFHNNAKIDKVDWIFTTQNGVTTVEKEVKYFEDGQ